MGRCGVGSTRNLSLHPDNDRAGRGSLMEPVWNSGVCRRLELPGKDWDSKSRSTSAPSTAVPGRPSSPVPEQASEHTLVGQAAYSLWEPG